MKRIEFIAPVEAMRGNLSGKQDLVYPTNDNKAYESPVGSVNYARNYAPRFIGAKIAKSGLKYFAVRTKSATHLTAAAKHAMALLGGAGAIYAAIVKDATKKAAVMAVYEKARELGETKSFRAYVMEEIRWQLEAHALVINFARAGVVATVDNPWGKFSGTLDITISDEVRIKFWTELVLNGVAFKAGNMVIIGISTQTWAQMIATNQNINGLKAVTLSSDNFASVCTSISDEEYGERLQYNSESIPVIVHSSDTLAETIAPATGKSDLYWKEYNFE